LTIVPQVRNRFAVTEPDLFTLRGHSLGQLTPPDPCLDSVHTTEVGGGRSTRSSPSTQGSRGTASPWPRPRPGAAPLVSWVRRTPGCTGPDPGWVVGGPHRRLRRDVAAAPDR